jgi:hypothetical protein
MPWAGEHHPGRTHDKKHATNKAGDHEGTLQAVSAQAQGRCRCAPLLGVQGTLIWAWRWGPPAGAPGRAGGGRRRQNAGRCAPIVRARRAGHEGGNLRPVACRRGPWASGGGRARRRGGFAPGGGGAWGGQNNVGDACTPTAEVPGSTCSTQIPGIALQDRSGKVRCHSGEPAYFVVVFVLWSNLQSLILPSKFRIWMMKADYLLAGKPAEQPVTYNRQPVSRSLLSKYIDKNTLC